MERYYVFVGTFMVILFLVQAQNQTGTHKFVVFFSFQISCFNLIDVLLFSGCL